MFPWISVLVLTVLLGSVWQLWASLRRSGSGKGTKHLVVISADSQATIEWWVRSYVFWNWVRGEVCRCTCIDLGSTDDTLAILQRLKRRFSWIEVRRFNAADRECPSDQLIPERLQEVRPAVLDLRQLDNARARSVVQDLL